MAKNKPGPKIKPYEERKHAVTIYLIGAQLSKLGGLGKAKEMVLEYLNGK